MSHINSSNYSYYCGWRPDLSVEYLKKYADYIDDFELIGKKKDYTGGQLLLWKFTRKLLNGEDIKNIAQVQGDCVSHGTRNTVVYLAATEIAMLGDREKLLDVFPTYFYSVQRVLIGGGQLRGSDGSTGHWAAEGVKKYGAINWSEELRYDRATVRRWRDRKPEQKYLDIGMKHLIKTTARVRSYDKAKESLMNGYPIIVCSSRGFNMRGRVDKGKLWFVPQGVWYHSMSFIGVDDDPSRPGLYCMNSWGPDAHGRSPDGAPPGGAWVDADVCDYMLSQGDSYAFSLFDGFKVRDLDESDFSIF